MLFSSSSQGQDLDLCADLLCDHHIGIDLDGIFLPDIPAARYRVDLAAALAERDQLKPYPVSVLPCFHKARTTTIITGRPQVDRECTQRWLERHGFGHLQLIMRDSEYYPSTPAGVAQHKAETILHLGCRVFIESELPQATLISHHIPQVLVIWWDANAKASSRLAE